MTREEEFSKVKKIIKAFYPMADCGLFDTRNIVGDTMSNLFDGEYFQVDICYHYSYFEVFGTTQNEFDELIKLYNELEEKEND